MNNMFSLAFSFNQKLCGAAWVNSEATKANAFGGTSGSISEIVCIPAVTFAATPDGPHVSTRPERELIARATFTSARTPLVARVVTRTAVCPKCSAFAKSGRKSCCAPGGAWFQNCGGAGTKIFVHKWVEGVAACKRKFGANDVVVTLFNSYFFKEFLTNNTYKCRQTRRPRSTFPYAPDVERLRNLGNGVAVVAAVPGSTTAEELASGNCATRGARASRSAKRAHDR